MISLLLLACVIDRTGQSGTDQLHKELAEHDRRVQELEGRSTDASHRINQLEDVTRARGQDEILKMESIDQVRAEVARMRGDFEVLARDTSTSEEAGVGFQVDADWRLRYLESRIANLERQLRISPPAPPPRPGEAVPEPTSTGTPGTTTTSVGGGTTPPATPAAPLTADEAFALITTHLQENRGAAARAIAEAFVRENPKSDRVPEALYRVAESYQNENNFSAAATAFQKVLSDFPDSTWAPWSMLRQGECFQSMGRQDEAKLFWNDVVKLYPKSKAAKEAKTYLAK